MHIYISLCIRRIRIARTKLMLQVTSAAAHRKARTHGRICGTSYSFSVISFLRSSFASFPFVCRPHLLTYKNDILRQK